MRTKRSGHRWAVMGAVTLLAVLAAGEAAAQLISEGDCSDYVLSSDEVEFAAAGGSGSFTVTWTWTAPTTGSICFLFCSAQACRVLGTPVTTDSWITIDSWQSDTVSYTVAENTTINDRSGTIAVGDATFTVAQDGFQCPSAPVSSSTVKVGHGGGTHTVTGSTNGDCDYPVSDDQSWISVNGSSIGGDDPVTITVDPNSGVARNGTVSIGSASIMIMQAAAPCPASPDSVSPTSRRSPYGGERFGVTASNERPDCTFSVNSNKDWIDPRASSVVGGGTVNINVKANPGAERSGTVSIGGRTVSITQRPAPCPGSLASVTPSSRTSPYGGETFNASASNERTDCPFSVSSNRSWIRVGASSVDGGGTVSITVDPNNSGQRSGTVSIGGRSVSITQRPAPCPGSLASVTPSSRTSPYGGETFNASASNERTDCPFSVSSNRSWIRVGASSVNGGGTVSITVDPNNSGQRSGTVSIGGRSVSIMQRPAPCPNAPGVDPTSVTFGAAGTGSGGVEVSGSDHCGYDVEVSSGAAAWLSADVTRASGGDTVTLSARVNSGGERMGTVTVGTSIVEVTQTAAACPAAPGVVPTSVTFGAAGTGSGGVEVSGSDHCGYDVEVSSGAAAWLSADVTRASGGDTVTLSARVNSGGERMGTVTVGTSIVEVTQTAAACPAAPGVVPTSVTFGAAGTGSGGVEVSGSDHCGYDVEVSSGAAAWLSADVTRASGGDTVTLSATVNSGGERMGTVTVGAASVQITQANGCPALPGGVPGRLDFGSGVESRAVTLTEDAGCPYAVTKDAAWITVDPASAAGNGTVTVTVTAHSGPLRMGTVTIGDASVQITQENGCPGSPGGVPGTLAYGSSAESKTVTLTEDAGCPFAVTKDAAWITVDPSSAAGNGTVTVTVSAHSGPERRGTVTIGDASVAITQADGCTAAGGTTSLTFGKTAGAQDATAGGSAACTFAVSDDQDWIEVGAASVAGGGTVAVTVEANSGPARTGTVTVGDASVAVTQADGCTAAGSTAALTFGSGTGAQDATAGGSAACTFAVSDDQDWILVSASSVAGGGTVTVTVPEHTGTVARTGTVTIGIASVQITQAGGCLAAPGVTVPLVSFGNGGGALAVGVGESSVCEYAVTADPAWVTVQPARVTGGGTVTVTVPEDLSGGGPRRGTVTIGAAGVRVAQGNTPPVAAADAVTTWRETATPVAVLANDTDADDDPLAVAAVVTAPAQGTAAVSADGQTVTYTSAAGWAGDETFTYQVTDDVGGTAEATVTVTVRAAAPFTDPVLTVGVTPIKAVHMTELRTRADAVRVGCGLTAATWTDPVLTAGVTPIKAAHMTELRAAVTAAYAGCTQTAPAWTDPVLTTGVTPIKAAHLLELREAVIALE